MKLVLVGILSILSVFVAVALVFKIFSYSSENGLVTEMPPERILQKYSIENLSQGDLGEVNIRIIDTIEEKDEYISYLFEMEFDPAFDGKTKTTTGQINIPDESRSYPMVIMLRGYVDQSIYQTGTGTSSAASVFVRNGYITIAPDFLGYGGSDENAANIFESRFQTYTATLALVDSLESLQTPINQNLGYWDGRNVFIWAHSNGGQIAITALEAGGFDYPSTLWAPVTAPFPYSILYYTIDSIDGGKFIRRELAEFESSYNTDDFSISNHANRIRAPMQIHQGRADSAVPYEWNRKFTDLLRENSVEVEYFEYPEADHNLRPNWDEAVMRDLEFFRSKMIN